MWWLHWGTAHKICIERYCTNWRGYLLSSEATERGKLPFLNNLISCEISGFRQGVVEAFALLGCYATKVGSLRTFRDSLSVLSSEVSPKRMLLGLDPWRGFFWIAWPLKMGQIGSPETMVSKYQSTLCNIPEERGPQPNFTAYRNNFTRIIIFLDFNKAYILIEGILLCVLQSKYVTLNWSFSSLFVLYVEF
jgi:hypothetical protein